MNMGKLLDITGKTFGRLTAESIAGFDAHRRTLWRCACSCGSHKDIALASLTRRNGSTQSCGCLLAEKLQDRQGSKNSNYRHGALCSTRSPEYQSFVAMHNRCTNPKQKAYKDYGARGITICERWHGENGFENFLADMGKRPAGMTLDRFPDNDGNYEPSNCRWATAQEQNNNTRKQKARK